MFRQYITIFYCCCCCQCVVAAVVVVTSRESFKVKVKVFLPYVANYIRLLSRFASLSLSRTLLIYSKMPLLSLHIDIIYNSRCCYLFKKLKLVLSNYLAARLTVLAMIKNTL